MIGDDHARHTVLDRQPRILRRQHALDEHRQGAAGREALDVRPSEAGVDELADLEHAEGALASHRADARRRDRVGNRVLAANIALADPEHRQVDGDHDRLVAVLDRGADELVGDPAVAKHVELQPAIPIRSGVRDLGRARGRERGEAEHRAGAGRRACRRLLAVRMGDGVVGGRGDEHRVRPLAPEYRRFRIALGHVDQDPRADGDPPPLLHVGPKRQLVAGTPGVVAMRALVEQLGGARLEVGDRPRRLHRARAQPGGGGGSGP